VPTSPERFFNREISWLKFNTRVLEEGGKPPPSAARTPALHLDLGHQPRRVLLRPRRRPAPASARTGITRISSDGLTPSQQLDRIAAEAGQLQNEQQRIWKEIRTEMKRAGLAVVDADDLSDGDCEWLRQLFLERVFPVLTPLAIDPSHPFPFLPNQGFAVGFTCCARPTA
jgi:polyphosphate kinase